MEFWGVKVLPSKSIKCPVEDSSYLHISNAALGEVGSSAKNERVILRLKTQGEEIVLGTLIPGQRDHIALDLIISKSFQLSHNSSTLAVHFSGYRTEGSGELQELDREHDHGVRKENGNVKVPLGSSDSDSESDSDDDDDDDDDDDGDDDDDDDDDEDDDEVNAKDLALRQAMMESDDDDDDDIDEGDDDDNDDDDDDDDDDEEIDEEDLRARLMGKKRAPAALTPPAQKKIKTPSGKTPTAPKSGKKDLSAAEAVAKTPKSSGKKEKDKKKEKATPATPNSETKKAGGQHHCGICSRNFANEAALTQHNTAKHK
ncbi:histone deacetylase HDT2 isoform X2 [Selaginella moellendorffii]|uniref:histone deacetylase HDT2 isoform X2 n=1 Tax=Selaginella moellendorffii TaxID=88036 RepID=UPI000D1CEA05|nr:histone deacetylase HDT2 isoform X2 [Selaginella moellendorffii]|eukprot:XP_024521317.1 histone deacetylase HDT2 isoform X2 [Selaginella moellendorffii]